MGSAPTIQHILVPHDFGETAEHALSYALGLAQKLGSRVTIVHAFEMPTYSFPEGPTLAIETSAQIERAAQFALDGVARRAQRPGVVIDSVLRLGAAWREINAVAKQSGADLIVIGTHGRRGIARALLGSVAEKVVRTAPCPVLTVHAEDGPKAPS